MYVALGPIGMAVLNGESLRRSTAYSSLKASPTGFLVKASPLTAGWTAVPAASEDLRLCSQMDQHFLEFVFLPTRFVLGRSICS